MLRRFFFYSMRYKKKLLSGIYHLYIVTNKEKTSLEINTTGDLDGTMRQLEYEAAKKNKHICSRLIYLEMFDDLEAAIDRETEMKKLPAKRLLEIIHEENPLWHAIDI